MPTTRAHLAVSILIASACAGDQVPPHDRAHRHDHHPDIPAELPKLPSRHVRYLPHLSFDMTLPTTLVRGAHAQRIAQRVLVLTATATEPAYLAVRDALDRIGVPYGTVVATQQEITTELLRDGDAACHYSAVVFSNSGLGYEDASGNWVSALSQDEWTRIAEFERLCGAREAIWYAYPSPDIGLSFVSSFDWMQAVDGVVQMPSLFARVRADATIPYRNASGYRATIADPATTRSVITDASGNTLLALRTLTDGREALISTVDHSPYVTHSLLLEYDMIRWLTRGMFVGEKRAYLVPQVDDVFLATQMWIPGAGNTGDATYRMTADDLTALLSWQDGFQARLPAGSSFITDMAFNGLGTESSVYPDYDLVTAAQAAGPKLTWLNHTWDHTNMNGMTYSHALTEVEQNCARAVALDLAGFQCDDLVTPQISGLDNPAAVAAMLDAGVRYVVSDTSVTAAINPGNPGTNPSFNTGRPSPIDPRLYQIPRHPTTIFYDTSTPLEETDEYNFIYRSYHGFDLTYDQVIDTSSEFGLFYLLQGDIDPLMFHQANLADYGGGRSLYADWIDAVADKFLALTTVPIASPSQVEIGVAMEERRKLDLCKTSATIVQSGLSRVLELTTGGSCTVPVTGVDAPKHGAVETYAGDVVTRVPMTSGVVRRIPLR